MESLAVAIRISMVGYRLIEAQDPRQRGWVRMVGTQVESQLSARHQKRTNMTYQLITQIMLVQVETPQTQICNRIPLSTDGTELHKEITT